MKNLKKVLLLLMLALLIGCNNQKQAEKPKETEVKEEKKAEEKMPEKPVEEKEDTVEITDVRGRKVTVKRPIKNAYFPYYYQNLLEVGGPDIFERIGSTSYYDTENYSKVLWSILKEKASGFNDLIDVGSTFQDDFDFEKLVSSKPDVVVFANYQYDAIGENRIKSLEDLGVPVVFIDFTDMSIENHENSCRIIGQIFGKEEIAEELIANYKAKRKAIDEVVSKISENERKTAFLEKTANLESFKNYGKTAGKLNYTSQIANLAGIKNIYEEVYTDIKIGDVDPEYLLKSNPNLIFVEGSNYNSMTGVSIQSGLGVTEEKSQESLDNLVAEREGWNHLNAINDIDLYTYDNDMIRSMRDYTVIEFVAKSAYPEYFKDFDPIKENKDYMEKYLPLLPSDSCYFAQWNGK